MTARSGDDGRPRPVVIGKVGAPFGVSGWVKVFSYTDPPQGIANYPEWDLVRGTESRRVKVLESKRAGQALAVRLEGIDTREAAQLLTGTEVRVDRSNLPEPAPGEYYWEDLVGLDAFNREGHALGKVDGILELPAHPVVVLKGDRERLVPLVPERLLGVDLAAGTMTLDWHADD
jgi:16S rRNA processing protein RimM